MSYKYLLVTSVLIQKTFDKSKFVFKSIWLATTSNLFLFEVTRKNVNFWSFEKKIELGKLDLCEVVQLSLLSSTNLTNSSSLQNGKNFTVGNNWVYNTLLKYHIFLI